MEHSVDCTGGGAAIAATAGALPTKESATRQDKMNLITLLKINAKG
jgi:hypothetical protein